MAEVSNGSSPGAGTSSTNQPTLSSLHNGDDWFQRVRNNGLGVSQLNVLGYLTGAKRAHIVGVTASLSFAGTSLTFSSDKTKLVSYPAQSNPPSPQLTDALLPAYNVFGLGIDATTSQQFTIADVLKEFQMPWLPIVSDVVSLPGFDLINSTKVTLDGSAGSRSSLTFKPDINYTTWLRLQFSIDDSTFMTSFQDKFPFLGQISLKNTALVGLKTATCQAGFVGRGTTSRIGFETQITLGSDSGGMSFNAW